MFPFPNVYLLIFIYTHSYTFSHIYVHLLEFKIAIFSLVIKKLCLLSFPGSVAGAQQSHRSLRADHSDPGRGGGAGTRGSSRVRLYRKRDGSADATGRVSARCRGPAHPASAGAGDDGLRRAGSGLQAGGREGR